MSGAPSLGEDLGKSQATFHQAGDRVEIWWEGLHVSVPDAVSMKKGRSVSDLRLINMQTEDRASGISTARFQFACDVLACR